MKQWALAVWMALLCGCATTHGPSPRPSPTRGEGGDRAIRFGMFQVPEQNLADARELGMDFVVGRSDLSYLDAAAAQGLKVITGPKAKVRHRAAWGSLLMDEPDLKGISPDQVKSEYKQAKRRPIFLNLSSAYAIESYRNYCDVVMFDWYPVGWMPVETFYSQLRIARLASGKKPFYAVVQTFDWGRYPKLMPAGQYRKPTAAEVKAMTIWAAMNGASGIMFYPFDDGHARLSESPEIAAAIKESAELVRNYDWLFESRRVWIDYPFTFGSSADKTNAVAEASIAIRASRTKAAVFVVAANTTDREIVVKPRRRFDEVGEELRFGPLEVKFLTGR